MFKNKSQSSASVPETGGSVKQAAPSIISADLTINGNLFSEGDIQVDGKVEGDVVSKKLTISSSATVRGAVEADDAVIAGQVTGQIKARNVTFLKNARVIADVIQEKLSIEPGAFFEGNCRHYPDESDKKGGVAKLEPVKPLATRGGPNLASASAPAAQGGESAGD